MMVFYSYLEFQTLDNVQKPGGSEYYLYKTAVKVRMFKSIP
jgi:hypothetical protein